MAHAHAHVLPNPARITAYSGVIALHAAAFLLLMLPMAAYEPAPAPADVVIYDMLPRKPKPLVPVPPPPEEPRPRVPSTPTRTIAPTVPQPPVVIDEGPDVAPPPGPDVDDVIPPVVVEPGPIAVDRLEYASAPPPPYPVELSRRRIEGTVVLRVLADVDGTPLEVFVQESSGHRALDESARKFVLGRWRFRPAMQGDVPVQAIGIVPIRFTVR